MKTEEEIREKLTYLAGIKAESPYNETHDMTFSQEAALEAAIGQLRWVLE